MEDDATRLKRALGPGFERLRPPRPEGPPPGLPEGLRRFYALHDGQGAEARRRGVCFGLPVLPAPDAPRAPGRITSRFLSVPAGAVREEPAAPRWPFAGDVLSGGGMLFVDGAPGEHGTEGQVVALRADAGELVVLGEDFDAFLELLIHLRARFSEVGETRPLIDALDALPRFTDALPRREDLREDREWARGLGAPWWPALERVLDLRPEHGFGLGAVRRVRLHAATDTLAPAARLPDLRVLEARLAGPVDPSPLGAAAHLKILRLGSEAPLDLEGLRPCRHLRELSLGLPGDRPGPVASLAPLADLAGLRALRVGGTVDASTLAALRPELEELDLTGATVVHPEALARLPHLRALTLHDTDVASLAPLTALPALETLRFSGAPVEDLTPLGDMPALAQVSVAPALVARVAEVAPAVTVGTRVPAGPPREAAVASVARAALAPGPVDAPAQALAAAADAGSRTPRWRRSPAFDDPELTRAEQLERAARDLLEGLVAEGELLTASTRGPRVLAEGAAQILASTSRPADRAAALAEWLLDEDEVEDLLADDDTLADRLAAVLADEA
jgi:hypothetical protein